MEDKIEGLLIGSAIGDAAGGPVEFVHPPIRSKWTTTSEKVNEEALEALAALYQSPLPSGKLMVRQEPSQTIHVLKLSFSIHLKITPAN